MSYEFKTRSLFTFSTLPLRTFQGHDAADHFHGIEVKPKLFKFMK